MKKAAGSHRPTRMRSKNRSGFSSDQTSDTAFRSTSISFFRIFIQCMFCIGTLVVGFRFTREAHFLRASFHHPEDSFSRRTGARMGSLVSIGNRSDLDLRIQQEVANDSEAFRLENSDTIIRSRVRVDVGRHAILIRPWPHPDPFEVIQAHHLIARVQMEQWQLYGSKESKPIIAITTTFVRSFQAVHLTGVYLNHHRS